MKDVLVFSINGDYAHFRKFFTTSSPLTFLFPPPPTILGMLGAILGIDKEDYLSVFSSEKCNVSVAIVKPITKVRMGINLINTKGGYWTPVKKGKHEPRTQIRTEFVKGPLYKIYVFHKDEDIFNSLKINIRNHHTVYTLSLGLSELIADFKYIGVFEGEYKSGIANLVTVIPFRDDTEKLDIEIEEGKRYFRERIPLIMNDDRSIEKYGDVLFEQTGKTIKCNLDKYIELENGEQIVFF
jgi:CRISPR-associated protein Cas5h